MPQFLLIAPSFTNILVSDLLPYIYAETSLS